MIEIYGTYTDSNLQSFKFELECRIGITLNVSREGIVLLFETAYEYFDPLTQHKIHLYIHIFIYYIKFYTIFTFDIFLCTFQKNVLNVLKRIYISEHIREFFFFYLKLVERYYYY